MTRGMKRVLVLDAGGPGSMAAMRLIQRAGLPVKIVAGDLDECSPARLVSDVFLQVPSAKSAEYAGAVRAVVDKYKIDVILPSFHFGFEQLAKTELSKLLPLNVEASLLCRDKWLFYEWCVQQGYDVPHASLMSDSKKIAVKSFVKQRRGAGSKDSYVVDSSEKLKAVGMLIGATDNYIVQNFIEGRHWSVEALRMDGDLIACSTMRVVRHKAGNATSVYVDDNKQLATLVKGLLDDLEYEGPANVDFIQDGDGKFYILEVNPRFGSTIQFSGAAGSNTVAFLLTRDPKHIKKYEEGYYVSWIEAGRLSTS